MSHELLYFSMSLNPQAQEWNPTRQPQTTLHQSNFAPTLMPPVHLLPYPGAVAATYQSFTPYSVAWPPPMQSYYPPQLTSSVTFQPCGNYSVCKGDDRKTGLYFVSKDPPKNSKSRSGKNVDAPTSGKGETDEFSPFAGVLLTNESRSIPPRFRKGVRSFPSGKKASLKQLDWRPKKPAAAQKCVVGTPAKGVGDSNSNTFTTVMIKNIPNQLRRNNMLKFIDGYCCTYSLEYDFLYLPMDFRKQGNLGYGFVNFTTAGGAQKFKEVVQDLKWETVVTEEGCFTSKKICDITWARIQGKEGCVRRFENSDFACDRVDYLPVILDPPRNGSETNPSPPCILGKCNIQRRRFRASNNL